MTIEEAKTRIEWKLNNCDGCGRNKDDIYAFNKAIEALEEAERYRWHDLRKNPEDLPNINHNVIFATNDGSIQEGEWNMSCWVQYRWTTHRDNSEVIAWHEIEPFEEEA